LRSLPAAAKPHAGGRRDAGEPMTGDDRPARRRPGRGDIATLVGLCAYALLPLRPGLILAATGAALLLLCLRPLPGDGQFSRAARATVAGLSLYAAFAGSWYVWPAYLLVPLVLAGLVGGAAGFPPEMRHAAVAGRLGRLEWAAIALAALASSAALIAWAAMLQPDFDRQRAMLPQWPILGLIAAGLTFSVLNAILEEFIWRGLLLQWLKGWMAPSAALLVQAASFGAAHYMGFPSGFVGAGLAALYGAVLGALALRARGLLAPIIAHVAADAAIFTILAVNAGG
jgi:membrane protease YdiL (CAAX protease family)